MGLSFAGKDFFEEALSVCEEKFFLSEDVEIDVWRKLCRMMILWPEAESIHWSMEKFFEGRENLLRDYNFFLQSCDEHDYPIIGTDVIRKVLGRCLKLECFKGLKEDLCQKDWREVDVGLPLVNQYLESRFNCCGQASALDFIILSELAADFHKGMLSRNIKIYDFYSTNKVLFADILEVFYKKGQFIKDVRLASGLTVDVSRERLSQRGLNLVGALINKLSYSEQKDLAEEFFALVETKFLRGLDDGEKGFHKTRLVKV